MVDPVWGCANYFCRCTKHPPKCCMKLSHQPSCRIFSSRKIASVSSFFCITPCFQIQANMKTSKRNLFFLVPSTNLFFPMYMNYPPKKKMNECLQKNGNPYFKRNISSSEPTKPSIFQGLLMLVFQYNYMNFPHHPTSSNIHHFPTHIPLRGKPQIHHHPTSNISPPLRLNEVQMQHLLNSRDLCNHLVGTCGNGSHVVGHQVSWYKLV